MSDDSVQSSSPEDLSIQRVVQLRSGARVFMDHTIWIWPNVPHAEVDMIFRASRRQPFIKEDWWVLERDGFGGEVYGNGSVLAHARDLIDVRATVHGMLPDML